jgi:hypothetical protein
MEDEAMIEQEAVKEKSRALAVALFDKWVRRRQARPMIRSTDNPKELSAVASENFKTQLVEPRRSQLKDMASLSQSMDFADQAALLVMMELPVLETSTLLHRLGRQIAEDSKATYFSKVNMADNCGCGCGCCCAAMSDLNYQEKVVLHYQTKPYSIDPFNELGIHADVRDGLLVKDFLESFEKLSHSISARINSRYHQMGREFSAIE